MATTGMAEETLNCLLTGEIAAVETYVQAIEKFENRDKQSLEQLKADHVEACNTLRELVHLESGSPKKSSGLWGSWSKFVAGTAKMFGRAAALKALKEGEEYGLRTYFKALESTHLSNDVRVRIVDRFIPSGQHHIQTLDSLMDKT